MWRRNTKTLIYSAFPEDSKNRNRAFQKVDEFEKYIKDILETWNKRNIKPKFHVSEQGSGRCGHHSDYIETLPKYLLEIPKKYVANAIDEFPIIFIAAANASGKTLLKNAEELRYKESDRLDAMSKGLTSCKINNNLFGFIYDDSNITVEYKDIDSAKNYYFQIKEK